MKNFDIRAIFCTKRLRDLNGEPGTSAKRHHTTNKDNLKKSMNDLLSQIVDSLGAQGQTHNMTEAELPDQKILH